ncbi:MAG: TonB-dependent receptor [Caulobacter sp.]
MKSNSTSGVRSLSRRALSAAAVAGVAGLGLSTAAAAATAGDEAIATAAPDNGDSTEVSGVQVDGKKAQAASPKITAPLRDTPKSITVIPRDLIDQTGSVSLVDALRTVPGITFGAGEGGNPVGDRPFLRGYDAQSATYVDGLRDIGAQSREVFNVENVEVVKGATGSYGGRGGAGGGIFINNKAPTLKDSIGGQVAVGTADYKRATFDVNHVVAEGVAVRLNLMVHDAGVDGRDVVKYSRWGVAPSVAFGLGTDNRIVVSYYHMQSDDIPDSGIPYNNPTFVARSDGRARVYETGDGQPLLVDRSVWYGVKGRDFRRERVDMGTVRFEHDFGDSLHLRNTTRYAETAQDYIWTQPDDSKGNIYYGLVWRRPNSRVSEVTTVTNQTDFYGKFLTGAIEHNFAIGLELSREEGENDSYNVLYNGLSASTSAYTTCNAAAIAAYLCTTLSNPNTNDPFTGVITRVNNPNNSRTITKSLYAFDTIEFDEHWQVNLGLRYDSYDSRYISNRNTTTNLRTTSERKDDLVNYQAAVVYKPTGASALYLSYATASTPSGNALAQGSESSALSTVANSDLAPEENHTLEGGAKWDVFGGKLSLTGAVFEVKTTNSRIQTTATTYAMAGEKRVRGFEIGASGSVTDKWDVFGGYTYLDAIIVKAGPEGTTYGLASGARFPNTPKNSFALQTTYEVTPKIKIGAGANYMDKVMGSTNSANTTNAFKWVPDYWRFDANASYQINANLMARLNIQNLTDEVYYTQAYPTHYATIAPGRSAVLSLNAKF